jgi:hypothetical protein
MNLDGFRNGYKQHANSTDFLKPTGEVIVVLGISDCAYCSISRED